MGETAGSFTAESRQKHTPPTDLIGQALQELDPLICAERIKDCVSTIKTIALQWDHRRMQYPEHFVAVVEEEPETGVRLLRSLDTEAGQRLSSQVESSRFAELPQYNLDLWWWW